MESTQTGKGGEEGFFRRRQERKRILRDCIFFGMGFEKWWRLAGEGEKDFVEHSVWSSLQKPLKHVRDKGANTILQGQPTLKRYFCPRWTFYVANIKVRVQEARTDTYTVADSQ